MTQSASPDNSDMVSIRVSRATQEKLKKLKKGNMTYDDVISQMVDGQLPPVKTGGLQRESHGDYNDAI
jgi:hypothetical protein